ncbi:unnamed protein product [Boreogadus saida]
MLLRRLQEVRRTPAALTEDASARCENKVGSLCCQRMWYVVRFGALHLNRAWETQEGEVNGKHPEIDPKSTPNRL